MSKLIRLSPSGIEYLDYGWNFYSGCRHKQQDKCPPVPCWAGQFTGRFKKTHYKNGFEPTFYPEAFISPLALKKPARIGVCFMGDLFGDWVHAYQLYNFWEDEDGIKPSPGQPLIMPLRDIIIDVINRCPRHTFVFLTKNPAGLIPWSPFPDNCEVGFSAWSPESFIEGIRHLSKVEAKVKWCSLEPLLDWQTSAHGEPVEPSEGEGSRVGADFSALDWVALGGLTGTKGQIDALAPMYPALTPFKLGEKGNRWGLMPPVAWLKNIVKSCDAAGTKVFIKDNLHKWILHNARLNKDLTRSVDGFFIEIEQVKFDTTPVSIAHFRQECGARQAPAEGAR